MLPGRGASMAPLTSAYSHVRENRSAAEITEGKTARWAIPQRRTWARAALGTDLKVKTWTRAALGVDLKVKTWTRAALGKDLKVKTWTRAAWMWGGNCAIADRPPSAGCRPIRKQRKRTLRLRIVSSVWLGN